MQAFTLCNKVSQMNLSSRPAQLPTFSDFILAVEQLNATFWTVWGPFAGKNKRKACEISFIMHMHYIAVVISLGCKTTDKYPNVTTCGQQKTCGDSFQYFFSFPQAIMLLYNNQSLLWYPLERSHTKWISNFLWSMIAISNSSTVWWRHWGAQVVL